MNLDQMAYRCPDAEVIGAVRLDGYRLSFAGGSGVATILPESGSYVDGVLWEISESDERQLDLYEGYPRLYGKETVTVEDQEGQKHFVMAYTMNVPYRDNLAMPSFFYLQGIIEGCRQNGMGTDHVFDALKRTEREVMEPQERGGRRRKEPQR